MAIMRYSPRRVVLVTLGLSVAGAVFGGLAGATVLAIAIILRGSPPVPVFRLLAIPGIIGGMLGAVCAPLAGWLLLRRVALGRAFAVLTVGTVVGGLVGLFLPPFLNGADEPIVAGAVGFLGAAVLLRVMLARQDP